MNTTVDTAVAAATISLPIWLEYVTSGLEIYALAGGVVLVTARLVRAWRRRNVMR